MTIALTLDFRTPTGDYLPSGAMITVKHDRTVRSDSGIVPEPAVTPITLTSGTDPVVNVTPNDDPGLSADSIGFATIVEVTWNQDGQFHGWSQWVAITSANDPVKLSQLPSAVPSGTPAQLFPNSLVKVLGAPQTGQVLTATGSGTANWQAPTTGPGSPSQYELRGSGSPYGSVVPPGIGYYYTDTNQTTGACRWISTGTTNTAWKVLDGDTGWRQITSSSLASGSFVYLRRIGNVVTAKILGPTTPWRYAVFASISGGWATFLTYPDGFKAPDGTHYEVGITKVDTSTFTYTQNQGTAWASEVSIQMSGLTSTGVETYVFPVFTWITDDPWPTTLPGSPA